jgi:hypothetical protein
MPPIRAGVSWGQTVGFPSIGIATTASAACTTAGLQFDWKKLKQMGGTTLLRQQIAWSARAGFRNLSGSGPPTTARSGALETCFPLFGGPS